MSSYIHFPKCLELFNHRAWGMADVSIIHLFISGSSNLSSPDSSLVFDLQYYFSNIPQVSSLCKYHTHCPCIFLIVVFFFHVSMATKRRRSYHLRPSCFKYLWPTNSQFGRIWIASNRHTLARSFRFSLQYKTCVCNSGHINIPCSLPVSIMKHPNDLRYPISKLSCRHFGAQRFPARKILSPDCGDIDRFLQPHFKGTRAWSPPRQASKASFSYHPGPITIFFYEFKEFLRWRISGLPSILVWIVNTLFTLAKY